jgi:lantibiotic biosynthesis protein
MKETDPQFTCFGHYILRTPLLPATRILDVENRDLSVFFRGLFEDPVFKEAIFLASPVLYDSYRKWHQGELNEPKKTTRLFYSLLKYYLRMSTRCTPFGLFAGCSTGRPGETSSVILKGSESYERHIRLDMNYLIAVMIRIAAEPSLRNTLYYFVNSSVYITADKARFVEYEYIDKRRIHNLVSIDYNEYLGSIFDRCGSGCRVGGLVDLLIQMDIPADEAMEYVHDLIACQILVSEIEPGVSGNECDKELIALLHRIKNRATERDAIACLSEWIGHLEDIQRDLNRLDQRGLGNLPEDYASVVDKIRAQGTPFETEYLFQAELNKPCFTGQLNKDIFADLVEGIRVLQRLTDGPMENHLEKFAAAFYERYEDREVRLVEALDTDIGIGYGSNSAYRLDYNPFFDSFKPVNPRSQESPEIKWTKVRSFWTKKLWEAHAGQEDEIVVHENDLSAAGPLTGAMPATFSVMASLHCSDDHAGETEIHIHSCGGASAANLLGRFCYNDTGIYNAVRDIIEYESHTGGERLFSEIVHLPESRVGNILSRPILREFEIPYLAKSDLPQEQQIKIDDLYISVRNKRVVLRSRRLDKEIEPRLSTAHNFQTNSLPVYNFLCDLQCQGKLPGLFLSFHPMKEHLSFLPRIRYKNVIFSPRTWFFGKTDLKLLSDASPGELFRLFGEFRARFRLPQFVAIVQFDNQLILNLEDRNCILLFVDETKDHEKVTVFESFPPDSHAIVSDVAGNKFANQFIFSLKGSQPPADAGARPAEPIAGTVQKRTFIAGDEWLYLKIYVSNRSGNRVLRDYIAPMVQRFSAGGLIRRWFFIRYLDPHPHLRLRLLATGPERIAEILRGCNKALRPCLDAGVIWNLQLDTYNRELERYRFDNILLSEEIFHYDSEACLHLISAIDDQTLIQDSWLIAMKSVDSYLSAFHQSGAEKHAYLLGLRKEFEKEYDFSDSLKKTVDKVFREKGRAIDAFFNGSGIHEATIGDILTGRGARIAAIYKEMEAACGKPECLQLLFSYVHMSLNRLFSSNQRQQEFIIYCILEKYYFVQSKKAAHFQQAATISA